MDYQPGSGASENMPVDQPLEVAHQKAEPSTPERVWRVLVEQPTTKRKSFTFVVGTGDDPDYVAHNVSDVLDWLIYQEAKSIILTTRAFEILLRVEATTKI